MHRSLLPKTARMILFMAATFGLGLAQVPDPPSAVPDASHSAPPQGAAHPIQPLPSAPNPLDSIDRAAHYSGPISGAIFGATDPDPVIAHRSAQTLRDCYLDVMATQMQLPNDPEFYKKAFGSLCHELLDKLFSANRDQEQPADSNAGGNSGEISFLNISFMGKHFTIDMLEKPVCFLGRMSRNDIYIPDPITQLGRVAIIFYYFPKTNRLLLVDPGSLNGISLVQREHQSESSSSSSAMAGRRSAYKPNVIELDGGERAIINVAGRPMTINPKTCIICMDRPRSCKFMPCGHFVVCDPCAKHFDPQAGTKCPICRAKVDRVEENQHALESAPLPHKSGN